MLLLYAIISRSGVPEREGRIYNMAGVQLLPKQIDGVAIYCHLRNFGMVLKGKFFPQNPAPIVTASGRPLLDRNLSSMCLVGLCGAQYRTLDPPKSGPTRLPQPQDFKLFKKLDFIGF